VSGPATAGARIRGALAASVTPLADGGRRLDEEAFAPLVQFLSGAGLDGILAMGTTGEGIMLSLAERRRAAELFVAARPEHFALVVHCGAQTTADTESLAAHAAEAGADAVAVIGPPYFAFDPLSLEEHFARAAQACAPVPFYLYEFAARSGYAVPLGVIGALRERSPNFRGLKVSDTPFDRVRPYLLEGLDVFVGSEPLARTAMKWGAVGCVSGLASAFPDVVAELVHAGSEAAHERATTLREGLAGVPFHSAMKTVLARRGVPVRPDVRAPLRTLTDAERRFVLELAGLWSARPVRP
jgi:dihydrodipicolinate synthase/N-acetylneuraminate lyase